MATKMNKKTMKAEEFDPNKDVKMGTPDEALWSEMILRTEQAIGNYKKEIKVQEVLLEAFKVQLRLAGKKSIFRLRRKKR